jgi:hypothetical protein
LLQDEDSNQAILTIDKENIHWARLLKTRGGYCLRACDSDNRDDDNNKESHVEAWELLVDCIKMYYKKHRNRGVHAVEQEEEEANNNNKHNNNDQAQKKTPITKIVKSYYLVQLYLQKAQVRRIF